LNLSYTTVKSYRNGSFFHSPTKFPHSPQSIRMYAMCYYLCTHDTTPPLTEVQRLIKAFMDAKSTTKIDLKRVSQLVEVAQQEQDRSQRALTEINSLCADYSNSEVGIINVGQLARISINAIKKI